MRARPVSELYTPNPPNQVMDVSPEGHYAEWDYRVGYEVGPDGEDVPHWGNTAIISIPPGGMTEPVYVAKTNTVATFRVNVLSGVGRIIRAFPSGYVTEERLEKSGPEIVIKQGHSYAYVCTGRKHDLVLHDVAMPAFEPGDEIKLMPDKEAAPRDVGIYVPQRFFDLVLKAMK